jgi:transposase
MALRSPCNHYIQHLPAYAFLPIAGQYSPSFDNGGTMVYDFWAPHFRYPCCHPLCNAHLLLEMKGISENYHHVRSDELHALLQEIKRDVDSVRDLSSSLAALKIADFKDRYFRIIESGLNAIPSPTSPDAAGKRGRKKQSKVKNLLGRYKRFAHEILSFMGDFSIPFKNNLAERDIRRVKLQQKIPRTFRSQNGTATFCRIRGHLSTVRKNVRWVLSLLVDTISEIHLLHYTLVVSLNRYLIFSITVPSREDMSAGFY